MKDSLVLDGLTESKEELRACDRPLTDVIIFMMVLGVEEELMLTQENVVANTAAHVLKQQTTKSTEKRGADNPFLNQMANMHRQNVSAASSKNPKTNRSRRREAPPQAQAQHALQRS